MSLLATSPTTPEASMAVVAAAVTAVVTIVIQSPSAAVLRRALLLLLRLLVGGVCGRLTQAGWVVRASETTRKLRRKIAFELAATVLGPGGNSLILLVLWPGWLVLAMGVLVTRLCVGW